jgi:photosystem II stability/assembly factor-like uncharacterized protein
VGEGGTVIATADGGKTWSAQNSTTWEDLYSVHFAPDGLRGWAVGEDGTAIATTDGGKTWSAQNSTATGRLQSAHFAPDGLRGWSVGTRGTVIATTDGGKTWGAQSSTTMENLLSVHFAPDGLRGWSVGTHGTVIATTDGGETWGPQGSTTREHLHSVHFAPDGLRGWSVGTHGRVIATTDGGKTWSEQHQSATREDLYSVHFAPDGLRGWALGFGGTVIATTDSGTTWIAQSSATTAPLAVHFASDGLRGWAVGLGGTVIATTDGGKTWADPELPYQRWPAPWFWVAIVPGLGMLVLALQSRGKVGERDSVADVGASDAAVERAQDDALGFAPLARGISRFLRNEQTRAPFTLAITGDWGTGKSSLMHLLGADLRQYGYRPIWFNVWHHQKEDHLFAALLAAIRAQVAPPLWTPAGLSFRLWLLWLRSKRQWVWALTLTTAAVALVTWLVAHQGDDWDPLWAWLREHAAAFKALEGSFGEEHAGSAAAAGGEHAEKNTDTTSSPLLTMLQHLPWIGAAVAILEGMRRGMTAIGADPATLLAGVAKGFNLRDATAQSTLRMRFAEQFSEVAEALPRRMVLVIDDLDRCRPEAVLDIVEAVNFLTSAGECFVIFGMATERVQAALSIAFERIAKELADAELSSMAPELVQSTDPGEREKEKRRAYARDYLQKLINMEVKVPTRREIEVYRLVTTEGSVEQRKVLRGLRAIAASLPLLVAACAVALGVWIGVGDELKIQPEPAAQASSSSSNLPASHVVPQESTHSDSPPPPRVDERPSEPPAPAAASFRKAETSQGPLYWGLLPLGVGVLLLGALIVHRLRQQAIEVKDSEDFRKALQLWTPLVALNRNTPRTIKRFVNWLRYLAMLQQGLEEDRTVAEQVLDRLRRLWRGAAPAFEPKASVDALTEPQLIALGALHEVFGAGWRKVVSDVVAPGSDPTLSLHRKCLDALPKLIEQHRQRLRSQWPPSKREQEVFERLLAGVRLSGDSEALRVGDAAGEPAVQ